MIQPTGETGRYTWEAAKERIPNDYKTMDFVPTKNDGFQSETERQEYYDLLLTREEQGLPNNY